jgi:hypothetical protein
MANGAKMLQKMRNNPRDWRIEELQAGARQFGIDYSRHEPLHFPASAGGTPFSPGPQAREAGLHPAVC